MLLLLADDPGIRTAPLPVLVAIVCLGVLFVRPHGAVVQFIGEMFAGRIGRRAVVTAGYMAIVLGLVGVVLWFVDNL